MPAKSLVALQNIWFCAFSLIERCIGMRPNVLKVFGVAILLLAAAVSALCAGGAEPAGKRSQSARPANPDRIDLVIYGGTPAGIVAAVEAARLGGRVVLIEPTHHLGGMMSSGLGFSDYLPAFKGVIGGIAREFFERTGRAYGRPEAMTFEPHVAEQVFNDLVRENGVRVILDQTLEQVEMSGPKIVSISTGSHSTFRAPVFIDASYEGDLMAKAGVSYTVGRESNAAYQETLNGVRPLLEGDAPSVFVDPGRPASGLLPFVQPAGNLTAGAGDRRVQAYGYRLCVTTDPANRIPFTAPAGYDEKQYELLARDIRRRVAHGEPLELKSFLKIDALPNQKYDVNCSTAPTNGLLSTDLIGYNDGYADASSAQRKRFAAELRRYTEGLLYFLGHSAAVPEVIRREWLAYGLCSDEFQDNGHWPYSLYVREGRRMVSDYVMIEQNAKSQRVADQSVGLAAYYLDSHWVQRIACHGEARLEGGVLERVPQPFPVAYAATVPKRSECRNLLVPVCLSASHVCFSAIRMEPTEMVLGQSAAAAAMQTIEKEVTVQDVNYPALATQLARDHQALHWPLSPANSAR